MRSTRVVPSAASAAITSEAEARRSVAITGAPISFSTPRMKAVLPSVEMDAREYPLASFRVLLLCGRRFRLETELLRAERGFHHCPAPRMREYGDPIAESLILRRA